MLDGTAERVHIARVRDQDVPGAYRHVGEHDHQPEDVVEWQSKYYHLLAWIDGLGHVRLELLGICDEIAVGQHRAFRQARRSSGVLEEQDIVAGEVDRVEVEVGAFGQHVGEADGGSQAWVLRRGRDGEPGRLAQCGRAYSLYSRVSAVCAVWGRCEVEPLKMMMVSAPASLSWCCSSCGV